MNLFDTAFIIALGNFFYITFNTTVYNATSRAGFLLFCVYSLVRSSFFPFFYFKKWIKLHMMFCMCVSFGCRQSLLAVFSFLSQFFLHHFVLLRYYYSILIFKKKMKQPRCVFVCSFDLKQFNRFQVVNFQESQHDLVYFFFFFHLHFINALRWSA